MGFEILIMLLMDVTYFGDSGGEKAIQFTN